MKVLFDSEKNWIYASDCEKIGIEDPETLASCLWDSFVDDMRTIEIERMKVETTPANIEFPEARLYRWASIGNLLAKIDWGRLKVFVDDKNELRLEYVKDRVEYKARIYELCYIARRFVDAQVPLGAYVEKEYDEICAGRSGDWRRDLLGVDYEDFREMSVGEFLREKYDGVKVFIDLELQKSVLEHLMDASGGIPSTGLWIAGRYYDTFMVQWSVPNGDFYFRCFDCHTLFERMRDDKIEEIDYEG